MATTSKVSSPLWITGIILIIIGLIMIALGLILYFLNVSSNSSWYLWVFVIGGVVIGIIGAILLIASYSRKKEEPPVEMKAIPCGEVMKNLPSTCMDTRPIQYVYHSAPQPPMYIQTPSPVYMQPPQPVMMQPPPQIQSPAYTETVASRTASTTVDPRPASVTTVTPVTSQRMVTVTDPRTGQPVQVPADVTQQQEITRTYDYHPQTYAGNPFGGSGEAIEMRSMTAPAAGMYAGGPGYAAPQIPQVQAQAMYAAPVAVQPVMGGPVSPAAQAAALGQVPRIQAAPIYAQQPMLVQQPVALPAAQVAVIPGVPGQLQAR